MKWELSNFISCMGRNQTRVQDGKLRFQSQAKFLLSDLRESEHLNQA